MFKHLAKFRRIFVTGPHRSGTTICSVMISYDTGYRWYKEDAIGDKVVESLLTFTTGYDRFVLQCPTMCPYIHKVNSKDHAIVLMMRNIEDIVASQKRIGWEMEEVELGRYGLTEGVIAEVKYKVWFRKQRDLIDNAFVVGYESLSEHPLWVPREQRVNFKARQTQLSSKYTWDDSNASKLLKKRREAKGKGV